MTRKDYILIAEAIRKTLVNELELNGNGPSAGGVRLTASRIADALAIDNPRFDRHHFLEVIAGERALNSRPGRS